MRAQCAAWVLKVRSWILHQPAGDITAQLLSIVRSIALSSQLLGDEFIESIPVTIEVPSLSSTGAAPFNTWTSSTLPVCSSFSSSSTAVVPLIADRVSLPSELNIVPMVSVLPPSVAAMYSEPQSPPPFPCSSSSILRSDYEVWVLDQLCPLKPPRVGGSRFQYVKLIGRMSSECMLGFTLYPRCVNGVFTVGKDADSDRFIVDAQPANRRFTDSPVVLLPDPSHIVQLHVQSGASMFVGKSDLSNLYHHLGLPEWMQPYFALPPLSVEELASVGISKPEGSGLWYPVCLTVPMGFSHAVFISNTAHEHVLYSSCAIRPEDNLLSINSPTVNHDRVIHGIEIDDFFFFSLNRKLAAELLDRVLHSYHAAGFVVKQSKVVQPTSATVKVIGFDIDGKAGTMVLSMDSQVKLLQSTIAVLQAGVCTGTGLAHLVGRWTWCMLVRRPSLSVFQHVYRFITVADNRRFNLWPSVRRELLMAIGLLPLLQARFDTHVFHRIVASDASELAAGVVSTVASPELTEALWPVCSSRRLAYVQTGLLSPSMDLTQLVAYVSSTVQSRSLSSLNHLFTQYYGSVKTTRWSTVISKAWKSVEHINRLELNAVLLSLHWVLSYPSSLSSRVFLLVDSLVTFYSLWKGRCSSGALLVILRKCSALMLAGGLSLLTGWIPSQLNPADGPSRLQPPGADTGASPLTHPGPDHE